MLVSCSEVNGRAKYNIVEKNTKAGNLLDYKDDMYGEKFQKILHKTCRLLTCKFEKVSIVMANLSTKNFAQCSKLRQHCGLSISPNFLALRKG